MKVTLLDTKTDIVRACEDDDDDFDVYFWTEGNGSCDCNRARAFDIAAEDNFAEQQRLLGIADGICLGSKRWLVVDVSGDLEGVSKQEILTLANEGYSPELLKKYGLPIGTAPYCISWDQCDGISQLLWFARNRQRQLTLANEGYSPELLKKYGLPIGTAPPDKTIDLRISIKESYLREVLEDSVHKFIDSCGDDAYGDLLIKARESFLALWYSRLDEAIAAAQTDTTAITCICEAMLIKHITHKVWQNILTQKEYN